MKTALVLVAAGLSSRLGGIKKEYLPMKSILFPNQNGTVLSACAESFFSAADISCLLITIPCVTGLSNPQKSVSQSALQADAEKALFASPFVKEHCKSIPLIFVPGGETRQKSVFNALKTLKTYTNKCQFDLVAVHDGARPYVSTQVINDAIKTAEQYGAAVPSVPAVDTQKETDNSGCIIRHLDRSHIAAVQTPQVFHFNEFFKAHTKADTDGFPYTDDTAIWAAYVSPVHISKGDIRNIKITYPSDIPQQQKESHMTRIGLGYDLHRLVPTRRLVIGGIEIPFEKGEDGHSDGDVLLHAITDALLGASGLGDIGEFFTPSDVQWKDANSGELLQTSWKAVKDAGWQLGNLDCVLALEQPKLLPYRATIRESIAKLLDCPVEKVFIKAKTGEKLGEIGRGEAVAAWATCLLEK